MRVFPMLLAIPLAVFASGCGTTSGKDTPPGKDKPPAAGGTNTVLTSPLITPVTVLSGRVVMVNAPLRYIVIDFGVGLLPQPGQRLDVYRQGNKVGEVRISGQARAGNVAADIMLGEAADGDEIRGTPLPPRK